MKVNLVKMLTFLFLLTFITSCSGGGGKKEDGNTNPPPPIPQAEPIVASSINGEITRIDADNTNSFLTIVRGDDTYVESYAPGSTIPRWSRLVVQSSATEKGNEGMKYFSQGNKVVVFYTIEDPGSTRTGNEAGTMRIAQLDADTGVEISDKYLTRGHIWSLCWDETLSVFWLLYMQEDGRDAFAKVSLDGIVSGITPLDTSDYLLITANSTGLYFSGVESATKLITVKNGAWERNDLSFDHTGDVPLAFISSGSDLWLGAAVNVFTNQTGVILLRDSNTGNLKLEKTFPGDEPCYFHTDSQGNLLGIFKSSRKAFRMTNTGEIDWQQSIPDSPRAVAYLNGKLYVAVSAVDSYDNSRIIRLNPGQ